MPSWLAINRFLSRSSIALALEENLLPGTSYPTTNPRPAYNNMFYVVWFNDVKNGNCYHPFLSNTLCKSALYRLLWKMAPTLNSTLIHSEENNDQESSTSTSTAVEETEKELSQYSPILARRSRKAPSSPHPGAHSRNAIKSTLFNMSLDYEATNTNGVRINSPSNLFT